MNEPLELDAYNAKENVIRLTVKQIIKDFSMFGLDIEFPDDMKMVYDSVFRQLDIHVNSLLAGNLQKLTALLYQIDIAEKEIMKAWDDHPEFTHAQVIAELIIFRELKKVVFRTYYKNYKLIDPPEE